MMARWAERMLYLGMILFVFGVVLRLTGYHQSKGFLQDSLLSYGVTPRAFLLAGAALGIFSGAMACVHLAKTLGAPKPDEDEV